MTSENGITCHMGSFLEPNIIHSRLEIIRCWESGGHYSRSTFEEVSDKVASDTETGDVLAPTSTRSIQGLRWVVVVLAILSSTFFYGLDNTVVADIQSTVVQKFSALIIWLTFV